MSFSDNFTPMALLQIETHFHFQEAVSSDNGSHVHSIILKTTGGTEVFRCGIIMNNTTSTFGGYMVDGGAWSWFSGITTSTGHPQHVSVSVDSTGATCSILDSSKNVLKTQKVLSSSFSSFSLSKFSKVVLTNGKASSIYSNFDVDYLNIKVDEGFGICGVDDGQSLYVEPSNYCDKGTFGGYLTSAPDDWTWVCNDILGDDSCVSYYLPSSSGICGTDNGLTLFRLPVDTCYSGTFSGSLVIWSGSTVFNWDCLGVGVGVDSNCSAFYNNFAGIVLNDEFMVYKSAENIDDFVQTGVVKEFVFSSELFNTIVVSFFTAFFFTLAFGLLVLFLLFLKDLLFGFFINSK